MQRVRVSRTIGIDLGTTNSVVAVLTAGTPEVITNAEGSRLTPSVVAFDASGALLVGEPARRQHVANPLNTFFASKRRIGTTWSAPVGDTSVDAVDLAAHILRKLRADAEAYLNEPVTRAVITVPARFDNAQRAATRQAGEQAGLEVLRLVAEPTAAAFAHGLDRRSASTVLVFDLGGGTLDVAVLNVSGGSFEVKATAGDTTLGGVDFDTAVVEWLLSEAADEFDLDLSQDAVAMSRLREAAETAKIELSSLTQTSIILPYLASSGGRPVSLQRTLTRPRFEQLTAHLVERVKAPFTRALADAGITVGQVDDLVMVGGASQTPAVRALVGRLTGGRQPFRGVNPAEAVALGAALNGGVIQGEVKDVLLLDATPLSLGIETRGGSTYRLIERNTTIPTRRSEVFTTAVDNQTSVEIHVVQGERPMVKDNATLGRFTLSNISPAPRGAPRVEVAFDIDADGIMHVSATETSSGSQQSLLITSGARMRRDTVEEAVNDAHLNDEFDQLAAAELRLRLQAETLVYQTDKTLARYGATIAPPVYAEVADTVNRLRDALAGEEQLSVRAAMADLRDKGRQLSLAILSAQESSLSSGD
jgi:molecular chaperone DnaK